MRQDYSGQNLRDRSFKGKDLTGANFSGADVTGANFTNATLKEANFTNAILENAVIKGANFTLSILKKANLSGAKAGLPLYWVIGLLILLFLLAVLSGFTSEYVIDALYSLSSSKSDPKEKLSGLATLLVLIFFFVFTICKGLYPSLQISIFVSAMASSFITFIIRIFGGEKSGGVSFAGVLSAAFVNAGIVDSACIILGITKLNLCNSVVLGSIFGLASFCSSFVVHIRIRNIHIPSQKPEDINWYAIVTGLVIIFIMLLSIHIAYNAMKGDEKFTLIHKISIAFGTIGGTCFHSADLTEANFTGAILQNTDLRKANLKKTYFDNAKGLDSVCSGESYLQNPLVRQVLVSRKGKNKNFDRLDLRGVNFKGSNLVDASFIGADLSDANLQDANLSRAKLVQTQLDGTDLTGATLTGAYIEDWGITNSTLFDGVRCEYVYMRLPTKENPDPLRKPDNNKEVFADGEFGDFIKPIVDTLDLYHNSDVDPRAIAISLKQLAENHPEAELRIVGMEVKGEDKFLLRAKTAASADKSELSKEYFQIYNKLKALAQQEFLALIAEKDSRIASLENMVVTALQSPKFYSNTQIEKVDNMNPNQGGISQNVSGGTMHGGMQAAQGNNNTQTQGDTTVSGDRTINMGDGNYNERIQGDYVQGNYYAAGQQNLAQAAAEIQQLLQQLEQTNPTTTTSEKMTVVAKAVDEIEKNPTLKARVIGAFKSGGKEALKEAIDHPLVNILIASVEGWQEAE
jgi:uncharacterized protein YjbI with pentapeptide repeats